MPRFKVGNRPFWDGVHKHPSGTVIEIDAQDYDRLLSLDFIPMDAQATIDLKKARNSLKGKDGQKITYTPAFHEEHGDLNPNNPRDLERLTPRGARVVESVEVVEKREVVIPETSIRSSE